MYAFWLAMVPNELAFAALVLHAWMAHSAIHHAASVSRHSQRASAPVQVLSLGAAVAATSSLAPLLRMAWQQWTARAVFADALTSGGVTPHLTQRALPVSTALRCAVPIPLLLPAGITAKRGVTYARVRRRLTTAEVASRAAPLSHIRALRLDLYWDATKIGASGGRGAPVLLYVHGGGWVIGDRRHHSLPLLWKMARCGWLVASINYRLAGEAPFPHMLHDCKRAIAWLRNHAPEYGGDATFIAAAGESAGGHLSLLLGLTGNVAAYQSAAVSSRESIDAGRDQAATSPSSPAHAGELEWDELSPSVDTRIAAVVDLYGVSDWTDSARQYADRDPGGGIRPFVGSLVLHKNYRDHSWEFVRGSPLWWVPGPDLPAQLRRCGIHVHAVMPTEPAGADSDETGVEIGSPAQAHAFMHTAANASTDVPASHPHSNLADMVQWRPVPPMFLVHGTADNLVPVHDSDLLWQALRHRRLADAERGAPAPPVRDVYARLPGAHHAFNFLLSARTLAMGDAVADWLQAVWRSSEAGSTGRGETSLPAKL